jgi:hypothetical protein
MVEIQTLLPAGENYNSFFQWQPVVAQLVEQIEHVSQDYKYFFQCQRVVAKWVEHLTIDPKIKGSNPDTAGTRMNWKFIFQ